VTLKTDVEVTLPGICRTLGTQQGLGGWSLDIHHVYDPVGQTLYYGDGRESGPATHNILRSIRTTAGTGTSGFGGDDAPAPAAALNEPTDVCATPDGTLYIADKANNRIRKVSPQGVITTLAGTGSPGYSGDGSSALHAELNNPSSVAVCAHGIVYVSDSGNHAVRKITPDGIIHTVAGTGTAGYSGDAGPAVLAQLDSPKGLAVNAECSIYIADSGNRRVRRIGPDKRISTLAGTGAEESGGFGDRGPAVSAAFRLPCDVAVAADGAILIADLDDSRIRRVGNDGIITTVYQSSSWEFGCRAVSAKPGSSSFYVVEYMTSVALCPSMVWEVAPDGTSKRVAGINDWFAPFGENGPATAAYIDDAEGVCFGPDGRLYIADTQQHRIRAVKLDNPSFDNTEIVIASEGGSQLYVFDPAGRHLGTVDAATLAPLYRFAYTPEGFLASVTDMDGQVTTIGRDASGSPSSIVGPYGHRTGMAFDADGWLSKLTNPAGETNLMAYAPGGLLTNVVSRRGYSFKQEYGPDGRIVSNTDPAGGRNVLAKEETQDGWITAISDNLGRTNIHTVSRQPDGTETRTVTGPDGLSVTTTTAPDGTASAISPDGTTVVTRKGPDPRFGMQAPLVTHAETTTWLNWQVMDASRSVGLSDPSDPFSMTNMTDTLTVNGRTWLSSYSVSDRTAVSTSPMGLQSLVRADALGRPVFMQTPGVYAVSNAYDTAGRLVATLQGEGAEARAINFQYAADGTLRSVRNALGETLLTYADAIGRVTNTVFADSSTLALAYDRSSDPVSYRLPHGAKHGFGYTPVGLTERYTAPAAGSTPTNTFWSYNAARQPVALVKPDGTVISNEYDVAGRLIAVTAARDNVSDSVAFAYDDEGRLGSVSRDGSAVQYGYDCFLKTDETTPNGLLAWAYDDDFRVIGLNLDGLPCASYAYDDDGALSQAGDLTLTRDLTTGFLASTALGNVTDARTFNGFGEVSSYAAAVSDASVYNAAYTRDALGRLATQTETIGGVVIEKAYTYDLRGRLTSVTTDGSVTESYSYDLNGNRTNSLNGVAVYDAQDRLLSSGSAVFAYDLNGSQTNKTTGGQSTAYSYDLFGQLSAVTLPDGRVVSYDRDPLNRVIAKRINGVVTQGWIYKDGLKPIAETDAASNIVSLFVYGTSALTPDTMIRDGVTYRLIRDVQGSVRLVVNVDSGAIAQRLDYDSFGNVSQDTNPGFQPFGFQSGLYDTDTALVHFGARWYDSATGRWLSKDPILLAGGLNLYAFCGNDPVNFSDPLGLAEMSWGGMASAIGSFLSNTFLNSGDIANAWELTKGADYSTLRGWGEGTLGTIGLLALTVDAAGNVIPGKAAGEAAIKTGLKDAVKLLKYPDKLKDIDNAVHNLETIQDAQKMIRKGKLSGKIIDSTQKSEDVVKHKLDELWR
jgi:RHS repeat-associated protein